MHAVCDERKSGTSKKKGFHSDFDAQTFCELYKLRHGFYRTQHFIKGQRGNSKE